MWLPVICHRSQASVKTGPEPPSPACRLMSIVKCLWATRQCTESALAWVCGSWFFPFLWLTSRPAETPVLPSTMGKHCSNTGNTSPYGWVLSTISNVSLQPTFMCGALPRSETTPLLCWSLSSSNWLSRIKPYSMWFYCCCHMTPYDDQMTLLLLYLKKCFDRCIDTTVKCTHCIINH